jgi:hypothetical protein
LEDNLFSFNVLQPTKNALIVFILIFLKRFLWDRKAKLRGGEGPGKLVSTASGQAGRQRVLSSLIAACRHGLQRGTNPPTIALAFATLPSAPW